jgi:hypothetical protein
VHLKTSRRGEIIMKKGILLATGVLVLSLCACAKENENHDDIVSQEQWLNVADSSPNESDVLEELDVFLVEPVKSVDQVASYDETQNVINLISQLSAKDFAIAKVYDPNAFESLPDNQVMLLFQSETSNTEIYGYKSPGYGSRGIIVSFNDQYSYFDLYWSGNRGGEMEFYEQDFDHDGMLEIAFCFEGAVGTGVEIYRLVMFDDIDGTGTLAEYEFTPEMQLEQFKNKLQFAVDMETKKINILKDGVTETTINWERFGDVAEGNIFGIDCLNQITFEINEDRIKMRVGIGILINKGGPTIFFEPEEGGELYFDVIYSDGVYEIN